LSGGVQAQARLADVAFDNFHFFPKERGEIRTMNFLQAIERGRFLDNFFETALSGGGTVAADEQRDFCDIGNFFEQVHEPDLADETGDADEHEVLAGEGIADGQVRNLRSAVQAFDRGSRGKLRAEGRLYGPVEELRDPFPSELRQEFFFCDAAVGGAAGQPGERAAWANHRFA
jgi:hypothetical protein